MELHHHPLQGADGGRNLQQIEIDRLVGSEHLARRDSKGERISNVSGGAGNGDDEWLFHGTTLNANQQMLAEETHGPHPSGVAATLFGEL